MGPKKAAISFLIFIAAIVFVMLEKRGTPSLWLVETAVTFLRPHYQYKIRTCPPLTCFRTGTSRRRYVKVFRITGHHINL